MTTQTTLAINGAVVRELRLRTGVSLTALAESAGIGKSYLSHIECGRRTRVSAVVLANLGDALGLADRRCITFPSVVANVA